MPRSSTARMAIPAIGEISAPAVSQPCYRCDGLAAQQRLKSLKREKALIAGAVRGIRLTLLGAVKRNSLSQPQVDRVALGCGLVPQDPHSTQDEATG